MHGYFCKGHVQPRNNKRQLQSPFEQQMSYGHLWTLTVKANAMAAWAEQVPDEEHLQPYLDAFRGSKVSAQKAAEFLVGAYKARKKFEASWKRSSGAVWGDDSDDAPEKPKHHKRKPETSDDSSEQKKKKSKKERKDKKRKAASSSGSSSSEDVKTKKKEKGGKKDDKKKKRKASSSEEGDKQESEETQEAKKRRTDKKDKTDKNNKKEAALKLQKKEALEAAYTSWRQGDVALFLADVTKHTDNMAGRDGAQFELEKVHELAARIPESLQPYLDTAIPEFGENGWLDATEAKSLLLKMKGLAEKTEAFLTSGTRASAGGSASK